MSQSGSQPATVADMHFSLGKCMGRLEADVLGHLGKAVEKYNAPKPLTFVGGVGLAKFSAQEATDFAEHFELIGKYANDAETLAANGISLEQFVCGELADLHGIGLAGSMQGYEAHMSADFRAALTKQSDKFAERFPVRTNSLAG